MYELPCNRLGCLHNFHAVNHLCTERWLMYIAGEKPYLCVKCLKSFVSSGVLKAHIRTHAGVKEYICSLCNMMFTTNGSMKRHMTTHSEVRNMQSYWWALCSCFTHSSSFIGLTMELHGWISHSRLIQIKISVVELVAHAALMHKYRTASSYWILINADSADIVFSIYTGRWIGLAHTEVVTSHAGLLSSYIVSLVYWLLGCLL